MASIVNVLVSSFPGLGLPPTLSIPVSSSTPITKLRKQLVDLLPGFSSRIILTTISNKELLPSSTDPLSSLLSSASDDFVSLRLSVPLCGGKGGFGSQLRAAGGRMSTRKKKNNSESNSSNRNLDGRRLRTVAEAKALAEYLALKPEMDKKDKEQRRKRWEHIVELAEKQENEITNVSKSRVDGKWVDDKEEAGERAREAVLAAMKAGGYHDNLQHGSRTDSSGELIGSTETDQNSSDERLKSGYTLAETVSKSANPKVQTYFGFDDDEESMSSDEDEEEEEGSPDD
ncbi:MAG: hypothetical protein Q9190_001984 [Brigantiaea leucoxantha]